MEVLCWTGAWRAVERIPNKLISCDLQISMSVQRGNGGSLTDTTQMWKSAEIKKNSGDKDFNHGLMGKQNLKKETRNL